MKPLHPISTNFNGNERHPHIMLVDLLRRAAGINLSDASGLAVEITENASKNMSYDQFHEAVAEICRGVDRAITRKKKESESFRATVDAALGLDHLNDEQLMS
jgi:hypothetical protein